MPHKLLHRHRLFSAFKYLVYAALMLNIWMFLQEDMHAAGVRIGERVEMSRLVEVFAATIDTAAWVVLLLLFELETSILPDATLKRRRVRWSLHGVRAVCAVVILNSLLGYADKYLSYRDAAAFHGDTCALTDSGWSLLADKDEFTPLGKHNCSSNGAVLFRLHSEPVLAPEPVLSKSRNLALLDVINAATWILVVILLELDVRLQLRGMLRGWVLPASAVLKTGSYLVLLGAALYWGLAGELLGFWDAFLWLVAFAFIEMNLFQWQKELAAASPAGGLQLHNASAHVHHKAGGQ